ncbi:MAG: hypothetical protein Q8K78_02265, partial [Planctomycetaceae bacterium]|nr:hypothetical protein [Planctomycetaceae bacterium]
MLVSWLRQLSARLTIDSTTSKRRRNPRRQNPHLPVWAIVLEQRDLLAGFTPGNLVVSTVGTGAALDASATVVTLREYGFDSLDTPTTATLVNSVAAPSANLGNNSGNLTDAGNAGSDAAMNLTADGTGVIVMGYDAPLGVASVYTTTSATNNRVIGIADAAGTLTVGPRLTDAFSGGNARAVASVDGSRFWVGGSPGVRYVSTNTATTSTPIITSLPPAVRFVTIATDRNNNQFLVGNTATGVFVWRTPGPTLPTLATQPLTLPLSTGSDLGEVVMLDRSPSIGATGLGGIDTIYVTNGQNLATGGSIAKYEWNGSSWVSRSSRSYSSSGLNGLTARATATGQVQLFATTRATTGNNELLYRIDTSAFGSDMSLGTYTVLATSSAGYGFRGVSFTPDEATAAPLTLGTASLANAGGAAVNLLGDVSFVDGSTFNGGLLAVSGGQLGDVVSIKNVPGQITTSDNTVLYNGTPIGIVSGGTDTNALRVDFNARNDVHRVTKAMIESLLEQLQFSTTSASSNRTLNLTVNQAVDHKSQMDSFNATTTIAINQPPSRLELLNTTASIAEQTVGGSGLKLADIVVDDDAFGTNVLAVSGVDADAFEIVDNALYLKDGTILNAAIQNSYSITVTVDDPLAGIATDLSANYTLALVAANRAPTAVTLTNGLSSLPENTNTSGGMQVAEFTITDDPFGTNEVSLAGANAAFFELRGSELWLKDGVVLDFESQEFLAVVIEIDDPSVGDSPDATATYTLSLTNVNEAPTAVTLQNVTSSLPEQTLANDLKIAEIAVTDDALGTNAITLSGADAAAFTVVGTSLFLTAGTYDFETKPAFTVTIQVDDTAVGGSSDA